MLETIKNIWQNYNLIGIPFVLIWISIACILLFGKTKISRRLLGIVCIAMAGILAVQIIDTRFREGIQAYNIFMLIPVGMLVSYAAVSAETKYIENWNYRNIVVAVCAFLFVFQSGLNLKYDITPIVTKNVNAYKVSDATIHIANAIKSDGQIDLLYIIAPDEITSQIQEYDVDFRVVPGLSIYYQGNDVYGLLVAMDNTGCSCLVLPEDIADDAYMSENGYRKVIACDGYVTYARI